jgi:hypothetical protein
MSLDGTRRLSRWMPPADDEPATLRGRIIANGLIALMSPMIAVLMVAGAPIIIRDAVRRRRMRAERAGEGLCTFARSFNRRTVDPWIIRAVYQALQPYVDTRDGPVPIRPSDRLYGELRIDEDELNDVAETIARRIGRPLENSTANPLYGRVETVGDLVRFFTHQPRTRAASA